MKTKRAAIYARISKADKSVPKVENQIQRCRELAEDEGYSLDEEYIYGDDGIAASGKAIDDTTLENRPEARRLLEDARQGRFDVLLAVEGERLARTYLDGFDFIKASVAGGVTWHFDGGEKIDPATNEEQAVGIFASGRREGRVRTARQKRRYDRERAAGMPLWGTRPFGYEEDRISLRPAEADLIREAVTDYLGGTRSMLRIAKDWTELGVLTDGMKRERKGRDGVVRPARRAWTATTVRQVLQRDRNAGILMYEGSRMPESQIQPIITEEELEALKARVKIGTPVGARAQTLLGGIIRCECGAPMHGTVSYSQRKGGPRNIYTVYKCSQTLYDKSRRHASIQQKSADDLVTAFIITDLYKGDVASPTSDTPGALRNVTERLTANGEAMAHVSGILLDVTLKSLHTKAKGELKVLELQRAELEAERDGLLAQADESGGLAAFMDEWRTSPSYKSAAEMDASHKKLWEVWEAVSIERKQGLIKARYRPTVKVGGRGVGRIELNPTDPSFGQPIEEELSEWI